MSDWERCGGTGGWCITCSQRGGECICAEMGYDAEWQDCDGCPDCRPDKNQLWDEDPQALDRLAVYIWHAENARLRDLLRRVVEEWDDTRRGTLYYDIRRELEKDAPSVEPMDRVGNKPALEPLPTGQPEGCILSDEEVNRLRKAFDRVAHMSARVGGDEAMRLCDSHEALRTERDVAAANYVDILEQQWEAEHAHAKRWFWLSDDAPSVGKGTGAGMDSLTEDPVADHAAKTTGETGQEKAGDKPEASERLRFSTRPGLSDGCQPEGRILSRESLKVHLLLAQSPDEQIAQPNQAIVLDHDEALRAERDKFEKMFRDSVATGAELCIQRDHWRERAEKAEADAQFQKLEAESWEEVAEDLGKLVEEWQDKHDALWAYTERMLTRERREGGDDG